MKKIFALLLFMACMVTAFSQVNVQPPQKRLVTIVADTSEKFRQPMSVNDPVLVLSTKIMYILKTNLATVGKYNMKYVLASATRYTQANQATLGGYNPSYYVDTANAQNVRGIKTFYSSPASHSGTTNATANTAFGASALSAMTTGANNAGFGNSALALNTTGSANTAVGYGALGATTTGGLNTAIGYASLAATTGVNNTGVGYASLNYKTTGTDNIGIGYNSSSYNTSGSYNVTIGPNALLNNLTGSSNITLGYAAGYYELGSNKLIINNKVGGADTAIIYGVMGATPALSTLQLNAATTTQKLTLKADTAVTDPLFTIAVKGAHVYVKVALTGATSARWKQVDN